MRLRKECCKSQTLWSWAEELYWALKWLPLVLVSHLTSNCCTLRDNVPATFSPAEYVSLWLTVNNCKTCTTTVSPLESRSQDTSYLCHDTSTWSLVYALQHNFNPLWLYWWPYLVIHSYIRFKYQGLCLWGRLLLLQLLHRVGPNQKRSVQLWARRLVG